MQEIIAYQELPDPGEGRIYAHGPFSQFDVSAPRGHVQHFEISDSTIYPGTSRSVWTYVPANYAKGRVLPTLVCNDGWWYLDPQAEVRGAVVLDNLIAARRIPPIAAVFVDPGTSEGGVKQRNLEYDIFSGDYGRFLIEEVLPLLKGQVTLSDDPKRTCVCGGSSGGNAAFTAAWLHENVFGGIISFSTSFPQLSCDASFADIIQQSERKNLRIFMQTASRDLNYNKPQRNWFAESLRVGAALAEADYDFRFVVGDGYHNINHAGVLLPDAIAWMFRKEG